MTTTASTGARFGLRASGRSKRKMKLFTTELRIVLRDRGTVLLAFGLPLAMICLFGLLPFARQPSTDLGGIRAIDAMLPAMSIGIGLTLLALTSLPTYLAAYRERGVLRRLSTTPARPASLLAAQLGINLLGATLSAALVMGVAIAVFGARAPAHPAWFVLVYCVGAACLFAMGLVVAAVAPTSKAATSTGMLIFLPMMALGGVWVPRFVMPPAMQRVADFVPLGALLQSFADVSVGTGPNGLRIGVMAAVAVLASALAIRSFRWE